MKRIKRLIAKLPELFFLHLGVYWFWETFRGGEFINYPALILVAVMTLQFFINNKILGLILGFLLGIGSIYMSLAVLSEFSEFESVTNEALKLLVIGLSIFLPSLVFSYFIIKKNLKALSIKSKNP